MPLPPIPNISSETLQEVFSLANTDETLSLAIHGSFVRGEGNEFSDIDLVRIVKERKSRHDNFYLTDENDIGRLVSVANFTKEGIEKELKDPFRTIWTVPSLRQMVILIDNDGILTNLKEKGMAFKFEDLEGVSLKTGNELAEYSEEVAKIVAGLKTNNESMTHVATISITLGMTKIILAANGTLVPTENEMFSLAQETANSKWTRLFRIASGLEPIEKDPWKVRGNAALELFKETASNLNHSMSKEHNKMFGNAICMIENYRQDSKQTF